jgi:drug/metabolite transporter (DMT)-like permease
MPLTAHLLKFLVLCLVWGLTWIATKVGIGTVPPLLFAATRFIAAGVLVSLWIWLPSINLEACRARERIPGVEFDLHCLELLFDQPQRIIAQE